MRLICPKCDAQYDVADDVIPDGGRDVQCSSCAHTWFQSDKASTPAPPAAPALTTRKPLDTSIADILREEAGREHDVPASEGGGKPATAKPDADETRKRIAQMAQDEGASPAAIAAAATGAVPGGNVRTMPQIDEINATLRARAAASDTSGLTEVEKQEAVHRRGFRRGFFFVLVLLGLLIAPYIFADQIVENLPQLQGYMASYVEIVDQLRLWLDGQIVTIRAMINDALGSQ